MSDQGQGPQEPYTEEELRAAYEAELQSVRVGDVLAQTVVSLVNLGGRRAGLAEGTQEEQDLGQLRQAIEGASALLPLCEAEIGPSAAGQVRQALSQLQVAYAQLAGEGGATPPPTGSTPPSGAPGSPAAEPQPAQAPAPSRLWVPGQ